jgi:hypothetical protein
VIAVGAGMGAWGNGQDKPPAEPSSPCPAAGPRLPDLSEPDFSALADRSYVFLGIYDAGTWSDTEMAVSDSSVASPRAASDACSSPRRFRLGTWRVTGRQFAAIHHKHF